MAGVRYLSESAAVIGGGGDKANLMRVSMKSENLPLVIVNPDAWNPDGIRQAVQYSREYYASKHANYLTVLSELTDSENPKMPLGKKIELVGAQVWEELAKVHGQKEPAVERLMELAKDILKGATATGKSLKDAAREDLFPALTQAYAPLLEKKLDSVTSEMEADTPAFLKKFAPQPVQKKQTRFESLVTPVFGLFQSSASAEAQKQAIYAEESKGRESLEQTMRAEVPASFYDGLQRHGIEVIYCKDEIGNAIDASNLANAEGLSFAPRKSLYFRDGGLYGAAAREEALHMLDDFVGKPIRSEAWKQNVHTTIGSGMDLGNDAFEDPTKIAMIEARRLLNGAQQWIKKFASIAYGNESVVTTLDTKSLPSDYHSRMYPEILVDIMHVQKMLVDVPSLADIARRAEPKGDRAVDASLQALKLAVRYVDEAFRPEDRTPENPRYISEMKEKIEKIDVKDREVLLREYAGSVRSSERQRYEASAAVVMDKSLAPLMETYREIVEQKIPALSGHPAVSMDTLYHLSVEQRDRGRAETKMDMAAIDTEHHGVVRPHILTDFEGQQATPTVSQVIKK